MSKFRLALTAAAALAAAGIAVPANALTAAPVSATADSTWQTNGIVWSIAYVGNDVVLGGSFTTVRPAGNPPGVGEVPAPHLVALDKTTGAPDPAFDPNHLGANGNVMTLTLSPDGSRLYVGGSFSSVLGVAKKNAAAVDTSSFTVIKPWQPQPGPVRKIITSPDGSTVYLGGTFSALRGTVKRKYLAAVDAGQGNPLPWRAAGTLDGSVRTMILSPDQTRVIVGGYFFNVDGVSQQYVASLDADPQGPGSVVQWPALPRFHDCLKSTAVIDMTSDGSSVFLGVGGYRKIPNTTQSCFEGVIAIDPVTGDKRWVAPMDGDVQAITYAGGVVYGSGHFKIALDRGGRCTGKEQNVSRYHLIALDPASGQLDCTWTPKMNGTKGGWSAATDGTRIAFGGDFTDINESPQQGFVQFGP